MIKALASLLSFVVLVSACSKQEAPTTNSENKPVAESTPAATAAPAAEDVKISSLKLGKSVSADNKIVADTVGFGTTDTIYAGVEVSGKGKAHLKATWTHIHGDEVSVVNEAEQSVDSNGIGATEFHISNPNGWPAGDYKVEVKLNDTLSETKTFSVSDHQS